MISEQIRFTQKKYGSRAMITAIVVGLCCILAGYTTIGKGFILGTLFSVINFVLMGFMIPHTLNPSQKKSAFLSFGSIFVRFLIMAIPLIIAAKFDNFDFFAVIPGLLMIQLVILTERVWLLISGADNERVPERKTGTEKKA